MDRPNYSILLCPDGFLVREHVARLLEGHPAAGGQKWERCVFWGDEPPGQALWDSMMMTGMFGGPRAVIVRNAHLWKKSAWEEISAALARPLTKAWPLLCLEGEWERGRAKGIGDITGLRCWSHAEKKGWLWIHGGLVERMPSEARRSGIAFSPLRPFVEERAKGMGLRLTADAMNRFCTVLTPDAGCVESELGKIRAFCGPRRTGKTDTVTEEMVGAMFSSASVDTFACLNAVEAGNLAAVWREVARNGGDEGLFFMLQSMLDKRFRTMWDMLVDDSLQGVQPYALQLLRPLAARLGLEGVAQGLAVIEDAELKLKSGAWQGSQVLDSFLVTMTLLCGQCLRPDGTVRDRPSADRQGSVGPASREGGRGGM